MIRITLKIKATLSGKNGLAGCSPLRKFHQIPPKTSKLTCCHTNKCMNMTETKIKKNRNLLLKKSDSRYCTINWTWQMRHIFNTVTHAHMVILTF